ncbi:MAG TPA: SDR family oxidoreductase [Actinobacteria bacterium]|nr:SDR family oxidoreductase [Actinomycetota bacterium]
MNDGYVAVIPGGTGSVGRALLPLLVARNFRLAVTYLLPEEARLVEEELDLDEDRLMLRRVDATDRIAMEKFMQDVVDTFGPFQVMCSLVGGWAGGRDVDETDDVRWDRMLDLNLRSAFNAVRAAVPHMRGVEWGRIILMGSQNAVDAPAGQAAYNVAKAGVIALARSVGAELSDTNVTANVLLPTVIDTEATRAALPYADYVDWPKPAEIAEVINFLASPRSAVVNRAAIPVTGNT